MFHTTSSNNRVRTLFHKQFPRTLKDSDWFFQDSKIHINPFTSKILILFLLTVCHTFLIMLVRKIQLFLEFKRFPELSRTGSLFPRLSSPGKCHNKIPGLSRFSRTRTNPEYKVQNKLLSTRSLKMNSPPTLLQPVNKKQQTRYFNLSTDCQTSF